MANDQDFPRAVEFASWLEEELNGFASSARQHERSAQESVPEGASAVFNVLQQAWDAYAILVRQDEAYRISMPLAAFMIANDAETRANVEQRLDLLERYLRLTAQRYEQKDGEEAQLRQTLFNNVADVLIGGGSKELFDDVFAAAFEEEAGDEEPDYEALEEAGGPYAVAYVYDELWAAESSYAGTQPPFDRADGVHLIKWAPLDDAEREVLRNLIDGRFALREGKPVAFDEEGFHAVDEILKSAREKLL